MVCPDLSTDYYKNLLKQSISVNIEDAIFRNEKAFCIANLRNHLPFWEHEILKDHPHKQNLLKWIQGVQIEDFLNSFTSGEFQGKQLNSYYPEPCVFENYVPQQFEQFMDSTVQEWLNLGVLEEWEKVKLPSDPPIPVVVCPLGVEPKKPRGLWDGRYVNEYCRDIPFTMDNAAKLAEVSWKDAYLFKIDHKNGYFHVPLHKKSRKFFGVFWKGKYYVLTVLPFGWKPSPLIYHSLTEALNMYVRSLDIPGLGWIDDVIASTERKFMNACDEEQFQSAFRAMVVLTRVLFKAGYFLGTKKCNLIPEKVLTYLGIDCDTLHERFLVPEERVLKYVPVLRDLTNKQWVSFSQIEKIVGKLVSLECAVPAGMWYTREQYSALRLSGVPPTATKATKDRKFIKVSDQMLEEWNAWIYFLQINKGSPWKKFSNVFLQADISSDSSGRTFAGVVDFPLEDTRITAGDFEDDMLEQDIQVKEGFALRATLQMLLCQVPERLKGKNVICKVDNQVVKAVWERKGTSQNLALNNIGKDIYWLQYWGEFFLSLEYVRSELNVSDEFTRQSPGLEASLSHHTFLKLWNKWGPFEWDLMASSANVMRDPVGRKLKFFSRYFDQSSKGVNVFSQNLLHLEKVYCFPPLPIIGTVLKYLEQQKVDCVLVLPATNEPWVNLVSAYIVDLEVISKPFCTKAFTVLNNSGKRIPKKYPYSMLAVKLSFKKTSSLLEYLL